MWFALKGDERITRRCATEECHGQPTWKLESGGVGSFYCSGCKEQLTWIARNVPALLREPDEILRS